MQKQYYSRTGQEALEVEEDLHVYEGSMQQEKKGGEDKSLGQVREERQGWVGNILR
jgi:hypothetical protein